MTRLGSTKEKELKQFIGLANYFRNYLRNLSRVMAPLQDMLVGYQANRGKLLHWTQETELAYDEVMGRLRNCPTLYFMDDTSPIHLFTDASERGYSGYLCQVVNGEERPIAFISKSVSGSEVNWSTFEKECYAIYYSIQELEHLLSGRHFTLHTDHKSLLKLMEGGSKKVHAWKLAVAMHDFVIEYVKGSDNDVADSFQCPRLQNFVAMYKHSRGVPPSPLVAAEKLRAKTAKGKIVAKKPAAKTVPKAKAKAVAPPANPAKRCRK